MATQDAPHETSLARRFIIGGLVIVLILVVTVWFIAPGSVSTNDAQVDGHIHPLNARVSGTVTWVNPVVNDTHFVQSGTILARLNQNDYEPTVDRLEGDIQSTEAQLMAAKLNVQISETTTRSRLSAARAAVAEARDEMANAGAKRL